MAEKKYSIKELRHGIDDFCMCGECTQMCEKGRCVIDAYCDWLEGKV